VAESSYEVVPPRCRCGSYNFATEGVV